MKRRKNIRRLRRPLRHPDHPRPRTRREFLSQGFIFGSGLVLGGTTLTCRCWQRTRGAVADPAALALLDAQCRLRAASGAGKIPFICFDLAGARASPGRTCWSATQRPARFPLHGWL